MYNNISINAPPFSMVNLHTQKYPLPTLFVISFKTLKKFCTVFILQLMYAIPSLLCIALAVDSSLQGNKAKSLLLMFFHS